MKIKLVGIPVRDQQKALDFYTNILGFVKKVDFPVGGGNRWLTVVAKDDQDGIQMLLEPAPLHFEPSRVYQDELKKANLPYTQLYVDNIQEEFTRLTNLGVEFTMNPTIMDTVEVAVFDDTCGNLIQLVEEK